MRKLCTCLFYGLCVFTIVFSLFWMALPKLSLPVPDPGSEAPPSSAADLAAQAMPELAAQSYRLCDKGGRVAVYRCGTNGQPVGLSPSPASTPIFCRRTMPCASSAV